MSNNILPGQTIGIINGGHVAKQIAQTAKKLGYRVGVLDPDSDSAAGRFADWKIIAKNNDFSALTDFASKSDVLTYDSDIIDTNLLSELLPYIEIPQNPDNIAITQDRLIGRAFLDTVNINIAPYATVTSVEDLTEAIISIGYPCILKPIQIGAFEQPPLVLYEEDDIKKAAPLFDKGTYMLEAWIPFEREIAVTVARDINEKSVSFPITETRHFDNRLIGTITPARINESVAEEAEKIAVTIANAMNLIGVVTIEALVTSAGAIYVNHLNIKPQDVADYSLDACNFSHYEVFTRAILGLPIPEIELYKPCISITVFENKNEKALYQLATKADWHVHYLEEKEQPHDGKLGHFSILGEDLSLLLEEVEDSGLWDL